MIEKIYEDEAFVVFNKPAGLLVIPTPKKETNTLIHLVNQKGFLKDNIRLYPCHRLDRETSGVILFAKGKANQKRMMEEFKNRRVRKFYLAFIHGHLGQKRGELKSFIKHFENIKFKRQSAPKLAITNFKVVEIRKHFSLVEVHPITGRTNQIRIQFSEIGHPLVGERKYAQASRFSLKFRRSALHAWALEWRHPKILKKVRVEAPLPKDMEDFLVRYRN